MPSDPCGRPPLGLSYRGGGKSEGIVDVAGAECDAGLQQP
jgi:hypothetical protein